MPGGGGVARHPQPDLVAAVAGQFLDQVDRQVPTGGHHRADPPVRVGCQQPQDRGMRSAVQRDVAAHLRVPGEQVHPDRLRRALTQGPEVVGGIVAGP